MLLMMASTSLILASVCFRFGRGGVEEHEGVLFALKRVVVGSSVTMVAACWSRQEQQAGQHTASRTDAAIVLPAPQTHFQILCYESGGSFTKRLSSHETRLFSGSPVLKRRNNRGTP